MAGRERKETQMMRERETARVYKIPELVEILGLSKVTLREYFKRGKIKARKIGRDWVVSAKNLDEYINAATNKQPRRQATA